MDFEKLSIAAIAQNKKLYLVIGGAGAAVVCLGLAWRSLRSREKVRVGVVSQLLVHPLKSGKGISVALAECHHIGLKHGELRDRYVLVLN